LLKIENLSVDFGSGASAVHAVRGVSLELNKGETLALVGESGSGKSATALSVLRLLPYPQASHPGGRILLDGVDTLNCSERELRAIRGDRVGMIFQEPMTSLNPLHTIEKQINEVIMLHRGLRPAEASRRTVELLNMAGIPDAAGRLKSYPHELSGGQRQRVMIAMALANEPDLLIADEPTTALDVTVQLQVLDLLADLQKRMGMGVLLITHDLGIVRHYSDRVAVMHQGRIVETGPTADLFRDPQDDYTRMLLKAEPSGRPVPVPEDGPELLRTDHLRVWFPIKRGVLKRTVDHFRAVDGVSIALKKGRSLGVVGESGSGKTTLGLAVLRLLDSRGRILFDGRPVDGLNRKQMRPLRRRMQIVFQDPYGSLSPRMSVADIIGEGMTVHRIGREADRDRMISEALIEVGLDPEARHRYPHEFSGGQRQRIAIARALVLKPDLIILDEPTSSLDRSVQFQVVELLRRLQQDHGLTYIFITHDLKVVKAICHEIVVLRDGRVVEGGPADRVFSAPESEYTRALLAAAFD